MKNDSKGITLMALIITIIVLLILAGVSISLVVGQNGVLEKAQNAVMETRKTTVQEEVQMVLAEWQTDYLVDGTPYEEREETTATGTKIICRGGQIIAINVAEGVEYTATVGSNGVVGELREIINDPTNATISQVYKAMNPIVPEGYKHIEGTWDTGYVIQEKITLDEFVWIPVVSEESYVKRSGTKNYSFATSDNWDTDNYDVVANHVIGDEYGTNAWITNSETEKSAVMAAGGYYVSRYEIGIANEERTALPTKVEKSNYASVLVKSQKGMEPLRYVTQEAALAISNSWKTGATDVQSGLITGTQWDVMCNFIGWSVTNSTCTNWGNYYNVASKAFDAEEVWHSGTEGTGQLYHWYNTAVTKTSSNEIDARMVFATGSFINSNGENTMKKNIYDVAGNVHEWSTEITDRDNRIFRGGSTYGYNNYDLATYRHSLIATHAGWDVGFRVVLYVK